MRSAPSTRRLLAAVTVAAAALGAAVVPAVAASPVTEGRPPAPVVVTAPEAGTRWMPWQRRRFVRSATTSPLATALVTAPNATADHAGSFTFMSTTADGSPVRWNPCGSMHWVFNPAHSPTGGLSAVQSALQRITAATGLSFSYDGITSTVPTGSYLTEQTAVGGFRPVLVGWSTAAESTLLAGQSANLVGMDQAIWYRDATGATFITSGVVAFNSAVQSGTSGANSWYTFALHELGHAVGLGHTSDSTQIMSPTIPAAAADYGSGDVSGLHRVGGSC